jgi:hypothetical protein
LYYRWYQDRNVDLTKIAPVSNCEIQPQRSEKTIKASTPPAFFANPLHQAEQGAADILPTDTVSSRIVFHEAQAALRPLMSHVQTQEELEELIGDLGSLRQV